MLRKEIKERLDSLYPNEYTIISRKKEYTTKDYITIKHKECGEEFTSNIGHLLYKRANRNHTTRCPHCYGTKKYTIDEVKATVTEISNDEYKVLSKVYDNNKTKLLFKHITCGYNYYTTFSSFLKGCRCPKCHEYKNERTITDFLEDNDIIFEGQKSFDGLIGKKNPLSVDFYVPDYNLIIEYDGEFHYLEEKHMNREGSFESQKRNDSEKDKYFKENNYNLLRIPFWAKDDIDTILRMCFELIENDSKIYCPIISLYEEFDLNNYIL